MTHPVAERPPEPKVCESVFYRGWEAGYEPERGLPRRFKPSNFDNPITSMLNVSLFAQPIPRPLKLWERLLLGLGF